MELERFGRFTLLIDGIYKCIHKIKLNKTQYLDIKSVHVFWIYSLRLHPEGLTATELASLSEIDRSLVSREVAKLCAEGYIESVGGSGKRRSYNSRLMLTEKGAELAEYIRREAMNVQTLADDGISEAELELFYSVLERLHGNFMKITEGRKEALSKKTDAETE